MLYLSKSKYCGLWQCPKIARLRKHKPDVVTVDEGGARAHEGRQRRERYREITKRLIL